MGGSTPVIGYYTFKNYLKVHSAPKFLVISYCPVILYSNSLYWERAIKYHYLAYQEHLEVISQSAKLNDPLTYDHETNPSLKYIASWIPFSFMPELRAGKIWQRKQVNEYTTRQLTQNKGYTTWGTADFSNDLNQETSFNAGITVSPLNMLYLDKLIDLAAQRKIGIYWYTAPFNQASCDHINADIIKPFSEFIDALGKKNVVILQKHACLPNEYFGDPSHLNSRGAAVTTQAITSEILQQANSL